MWQTGDQYSQWALNPSAYQNVAHDKVDWAALAQQWIQMKDTLPEDQVPPAPPPPSLGRTEDRKKDMDLEGGEAPMEMEKEDLETSDLQEAPAWGAWNNWQQWGNWGWGAGGVDPTGGAAGVPPPTPAAIIAKQGAMVGSALPVPGYGYPSGASGYGGPPAGNFDYNQAPVTEAYNQVMVGGYWTAGPSGDATSNNLSGQGHGPAPFIRNSRQDWRRSSRGHDRTRSADKSDEEEDSTVALDAAKRRQLPAWIREGLEKMEREKQKKIDRDRQIKEREIYLQKKREDEEDALNKMQENNTGQPMVPKKSKFESDSEESDHGDNRVASPISTSRRKSRFRNADSPTSSPLSAHVRDPTPEPEPVMTQEEILHERMLKVRRMLTEILLEVTTEEMESVAQEVLSKAKAKGLGMYGDSDESESDDSSDDRIGQTNGADSDEELKDQIQRRKQEFIKTEREIEARLMEEEEKERDRERRLTAEASDEDIGEERQVEKQSDSKRPNAQDGIKFKEEQDKTPRPASQSELGKEENSHRSNNDHFSPPHIKKERSEDASDHTSDRKPKHQGEMYKPLEKVKHEKSASSDDNEETSSKSDSDNSSTSQSASSSSMESKRSSKKSSKNNRLKSQDKKSSKKRSNSSERKHRKSDKKSIRTKDRKRDRESRDLKVKDKKKEKRRKSRSVSGSRGSFSKELRKAKRSRSGESRRSKRSRSHESHRSKTSRRDSQSATSRGSEHRHKSHGSRPKEKSSYKHRDVKERSSKRRRDSSLSRSRSVSATPTKSRRHRSSSSSDGSPHWAKGKTTGR